MHAPTPEIASPLEAAIPENPPVPNHPEVPDEPLVRIRPTKSSIAIDLRDLWAYRELLYFLTWRDLKVRYKQTVLGVAWAIIQPFFTMLIFTLFFGKLAGVPSDGIPIQCLSTRGFCCGPSFPTPFRIVAIVL